MYSLRASVVVVDPAVRATYVVPVAAVSAIYLEVSAYLDTTGKFSFIGDIAAVVDGRSYNMTKPLADATVPVDATAVSALKVLASGLTMADAETVAALKGLADTVSSPDSIAFGVNRPLQDQQEVVDLISKVLARPLASEFGLTDDETVSALKGLSETPEMVDALSILLLVLRELNDTVDVPDVRATVFTPSTKVEEISVSDFDTVSSLKNLADGVAMNDGSEAVDGATYSFAKGISNVVFADDIRNLSFVTSRVESVAVTDAGILSVQDYCDLSYFAQDYVGISQSF